MNIYEVGQAYRKALLAGNADAAADLVAVYSGALEAIQAEATALVSELEALGQVPGAITRAFRVEQAGLARFAQSATEELHRVNAIAAEAIETHQRAAAALATEAFTAAMEAQQAVAVGVGQTFNLVASEAVEALAGHLADFSPLIDVLDAHAGAAAAQAAQELKVGLAAGLPTRQIAQNVADASGMALDKALTIARTETLRAYREVAFDSYDANADLVGSWMWVCGMQPNSCAACVAMHGTIHPLTERMHGHPNCGCASVPILSDIPVEDQRPPQEPEAWLAQQDEDTLASVFGSRKQAARYKAGEFALADVVRVTDSPAWGLTVWQQIPGSKPAAAPKPADVPKPKAKAAAKPKPAPKPPAPPKPKPAPKPKPGLKWLPVKPKPSAAPAALSQAPAALPKLHGAAPPTPKAAQVIPQAKGSEAVNRAQWRRMQASWVQSSDSAAGKSIRHIATKDFGAKGRATAASNPTDLEAVRWQYHQTQARLKADGVTSVRLYRGIDPRGIGKPGFSAESWTTDPAIARQFAGPYGQVMSEEIPAADVLAWHRGPNWADGGFGDEQEWLVIRRK